MKYVKQNQYHCSYFSDLSNLLYCSFPVGILQGLLLFLIPMLRLCEVTFVTIGMTEVLKVPELHRYLEQFRLECLVLPFCFKIF